MSELYEAPEGEQTEIVDVDVRAWVETAKTDPLRYRDRQVTEIVLAAIGVAPNLKKTLVLKGGAVMALAFKSERVTGDVDLGDDRCGHPRTDRTMTTLRGVLRLITPLVLTYALTPIGRLQAAVVIPSISANMSCDQSSKELSVKLRSYFVTSGFKVLFHRNLWSSSPSGDEVGQVLEAHRVDPILITFTKLPYEKRFNIAIFDVAGRTSVVWEGIKVSRSLGSCQIANPVQYSGSSADGKSISRIIAQLENDSQKDER